MIYLDNAATTRIDDRVLETMMPYLTDKYGNAGSLHSLGRESANAVDEARDQVANLIGARPEQIIFTSGGSEANNLVVKGMSEQIYSTGSDYFLISDVEHESLIGASDDVYRTFYSSREGFMWRDDYYDVGLVSTMWVNNETGVMYPIKEIAKLCHDHGAFFHSDCVQALEWFSLEQNNVLELGCDFISISSHKIHGPKGCGALYCKKPSILDPLINGSRSQEFGVRGGTEAVANIVGFGAACKILQQEPELDYIRDLYGVFTHTLETELDRYGLVDLLSYNTRTNHSSKILSITFRGIDSETLVLFADTKGVCISAGSACTAHEQKPSHVLLAMGLTEEEARNTIRVSFSRMNTVEEVTEGAEIIAECVKILSEAS